MKFLHDIEMKSCFEWCSKLVWIIHTSNSMNNKYIYSMHNITYKFLHISTIYCLNSSTPHPSQQLLSVRPAAKRSTETCNSPAVSSEEAKSSGACGGRPLPCWNLGTLETHPGSSEKKRVFGVCMLRMLGMLGMLGVLGILVYMIIYVCLYVCMSVIVCVSVCMSVYLYAYMSVCLYVYMSVCLCVSVRHMCHACLCVCAFVCLSVCMNVMCVCAHVVYACMVVYVQCMCVCVYACMCVCVIWYGRVGYE